MFKHTVCLRNDWFHEVLCLFFSKGFPGGLKLILFNLFNSSQPSKPLKVCRMLAQKDLLMPQNSPSSVVSRHCLNEKDDLLL